MMSIQRPGRYIMLYSVIVILHVWISCISQSRSDFFPAVSEHFLSMYFSALCTYMLRVFFCRFSLKIVFVYASETKQSSCDAMF